MKRILIVVALLAIPVVGQTQWKRLDINTDEFKVYIRDAQRTGPMVVAWKKRENSDGSYSIVREQYDCENLRVRTGAFAAYGADGKLIGSRDREFTDNNWSAFDPRSIGGQTLRRVCQESLALPAAAQEQEAQLSEAKRLDEQATQLYEAGRYAEAVPLVQRVLAIREKALGPEHPEVATAINNLVALYRAQGDYERAAPLIQRSLTIREKVLGPEDPDVATTLNNLAEMYRAVSFPKTLSGKSACKWQSLA